MAGDRMPPQSVDSERALLGSCLLSAEVIPEVMRTVSPDDFYTPRFQLVFHAIEKLWGRGQPVDAVSVCEELTRDDVLAECGGTDAIVDLQMDTPAISRAGYYAANVVRASRLRRIVMMASELADECFNPGADPDAVFDLLCSAAGDRRLMPREIALPADYMPAVTLRNLPPEEFEGGDWIVPGLLRKMWRVLMVGAEGSGKSTIARQFATLISNGIHPFTGGLNLTPRRALVIDAENPLDVVQHQFDLIDERGMGKLSHSDNLWVWRLEGGINFRERTSQMQFEAVLQDCRPELVTMGPVYKLYSNRNSIDLEDAAKEFLDVIDGFRKRFGFALIMEHHAPKGSSDAPRQIVPFGSSAWLRWPEFGLRLRGEDRDEKARPHKITLGRFRGDRVDGAWPLELHRDSVSSGLPWTGVYPTGTFKPTKNEPPPIIYDEGEPDEPF